MDLGERLKIIVTISKLIRKQTYFDIYIHASCLPHISVLPPLPSIVEAVLLLVKETSQR